MRQTSYKAIPDNQFVEDAENGTILGVEFVRGGYTYVTMCVSHPVFDYANVVCSSQYLRCLKAGEKFIVEGAFQKVIDTTLFRQGDLSDPDFGKFVSEILAGAITNTAFFVKYAIKTNTICIGNFIYQEIIKAEGLGED